jgi:hypothetical protein
MSVGQEDATGLAGPSFFPRRPGRFSRPGPQPLEPVLIRRKTLEQIEQDRLTLNQSENCALESDEVVAMKSTKALQFWMDLAAVDWQTSTTLRH